MLSIFLQKQTKHGEIYHAKSINLKQLGQNKPKPIVLFKNCIGIGN